MDVGRPAQGAGLDIAVSNQAKACQPRPLFTGFLREATGNVLDLPNLAQTLLQLGELTPQSGALAAENSDRLRRIRRYRHFLDNRVDRAKVAERDVLRGRLAGRKQTDRLRLAEHIFGACCRQAGELLALAGQFHQFL